MSSCCGAQNCTWCLTWDCTCNKSFAEIPDHIFCIIYLFILHPSFRRKDNYSVTRCREIKSIIWALQVFEKAIPKGGRPGRWNTCLRLWEAMVSFLISSFLSARPLEPWAWVSFLPQSCHYAWNDSFRGLLLTGSTFCRASVLRCVQCMEILWDFKECWWPSH